MQVIHFIVPGTPLPVELHRKKGSMRLAKLRPWRYLCSGLTIIKLKTQQDNLGQIYHMYPNIYLTSDKGLVFHLYLQKFKMDFLLSAVIFATANFN